MTLIDVGNTASDRAATTSLLYTYVDLNNPCNESGVISTVQLYVNVQGSFKVGVFADAGYGVMYTRSVVDLGVLTVGFHEIPDLFLPCAAGDYVGFYSVGGKVERDISGGVGHAIIQQDVMTEGTYWPYTSGVGYIMSVNGQGATVDPPVCEGIDTALNTVRDDYLECVAKWFLLNFPLEDSENFKEALILYMADTITAGSGGGGPTNQDVLDAIAALDTHLSTVATTLNLAIVTRHDTTDALIGTPPVDLYTSLGVAEGNLDAAITAFRNALMSVSQYSLVDVLDAITNKVCAVPQDVTDAQTSIETTIGNAVTTLTGEVEESTAFVKGTPGKTNQEVFDQIPTSGWATPTDVTNAYNGILEAIDDIPAPTNEYLGPPTWPGLAGVTLGSEESLIDQLTITAPMDGVVVNITTPPTKCGRYTIGGAIYDYKVGEVAFESDRGDLEPWQYLGFRQALYTPKTMRRAAKVRFRVLAGASGTCRIWTVT